MIELFELLLLQVPLRDGLLKLLFDLLRLREIRSGKSNLGRPLHEVEDVEVDSAFRFPDIINDKSPETQKCL